MISLIITYRNLIIFIAKAIIIRQFLKFHKGNDHFVLIANKFCVCTKISVNLFSNNIALIIQNFVNYSPYLQHFLGFMKFIKDKVPEIKIS